MSTRYILTLSVRLRYLLADTWDEYVAYSSLYTTLQVPWICISVYPVDKTVFITKYNLCDIIHCVSKRSHL